MDLILWLVGKNIPLGHFHKYQTEEAREAAGGRSPMSFSYAGSKEVDRAAGIIVGGMSQYPVAELVAKEWDYFPPQLRMAITNIANTQHRSNNVAKGLAYLDKLLKGRVLSKQFTGPTQRDLVTVNGVLVSRNRRINMAVAGAQRAHAAYSRPANYKELSHLEKRRLNKQLAAERRKDKGNS